MDILQKFIEKYELKYHLEDEAFSGATYILNRLIDDGHLTLPSYESVIVEQVADIYKEVYADKELYSLLEYDLFDNELALLFCVDPYENTEEYVRLDPIVLEMVPETLREYLIEKKNREKKEEQRRRLRFRKETLEKHLCRSEKFKEELGEIKEELRKLDE